MVLALERAAYGIIWHRPDAFRRLCRRLAPGRDAVEALAVLFAGFKALQAAVFVGWWVAHGGGLARASDDTAPLAAGVLLIAMGQVLNLAVFARLGPTGVFYGNRLGHAVPWRAGFPFSWVRHPQYVGTVLSIWGCFVVVRYPAPDWAALPLLETVYYALSALVEHERDRPALTGPRAPAAHATVADPPSSPRVP